MTPQEANARDRAIEALIAGCLREPNDNVELTDEEISRYVDQKVTLSAEDEAALENSKFDVLRAIKSAFGEDAPKADSPGPKSKGATSPQASTSGKQSKPPDEFVEAVVIAQLTRHLASSEYPLGRFRYNKLAYFSHRRADEDVQKRFAKKAAGPYSPWAKYQGPERIALKNGYVVRTKVGLNEGLVVGEKVGEIDKYLPRYPVCTAVNWVVQTFRYIKKEDLELFATVDFASLDLKNANEAITVAGVKRVIADNREWAPKLKRAIFSDQNISRALVKLKNLFPLTYSG